MLSLDCVMNDLSFAEDIFPLQCYIFGKVYDTMRENSVVDMNILYNGSEIDAHVGIRIA